MATLVDSKRLQHPVELIKGADIAAAATVNLANATGNFVIITGTGGPITSFGTVDAGVEFTLVFADTVTVQHNASTLILPGAADIDFVADDILKLLSLGAGAWAGIMITRASGKALIGGSFEGALTHVVHQTGAGVNAGVLLAGSRQTRTLNTVLTNEIPGVSLSSNQLTGVPAGTYYAEFSCPANATRMHKAYLRNVTAGSDLLIGEAAYTVSGVNVNTASRGAGRFTLSVTSTLSLQHRAETTNNNTESGGKGDGFADGVNRYSELRLWKLS